MSSSICWSLVCGVALASAALPSLAEEGDIEAVRTAVSSLNYVPELPSTVPAGWAGWEKKASAVIAVVGATARVRASAADIYYEATRAGLEPNLIFALVEALSRFDERAISKTGNVGLLQISTATQGRLGNRVNTLYQGKYNLRLGCSLLRLYLDREGGNVNRAIVRLLREALPQSEAVAVAGAALRLYQVRSPSLPPGTSTE